MQVTHALPTPALRMPWLAKPALAQASAAGSADRVTLSSRSAKTPARVEVVHRLPFSQGGWMELLRDRDPHLVQRNFHPRTVQQNSEIIQAFGTKTPHSGDAVLLYAGDPPPGVKVQPTPVLLVHGASKSADFWWDPRENGHGHGLPQMLREQGFKVYAVSFAHNQDDQFFWAQQIGNASERIRQLTGAPQIDLVGHSKGGQASRLYCTPDLAQPWMQKSNGDVRRLVLVAAPNGGIDTMFRHPSANYALYGSSDSPALNAPMSWEKMIAWGANRDVHELGFSKDGPDYWPGQRQMLARWDNRYALTITEPDYRTTYEGGQGFVSSSKGIDHYIQEGGNLVQRLNDTPIDGRIEVSVLAGDKPNIKGILNEKAGPSDGLLFLESALMVPDTDRVAAKGVLHLNHKTLVSEPEGQRWIADALLGKGHPAPAVPKVLASA